jgi:hypothetical protein
MRTNLLAVMLLVIWLVGCGGTRYLVDIDSIATTDSGKRAYVILPAKKDMVGGDLQFREFSQYLKSALYARGYREAINPEQAEIAVMLAYGIAGGTAGSVTEVHRDAWGNVEGSSTKNVIRYARLIIIRAYDYKKYREMKEEVQLWQTTIDSVGSSDDLRRVFPVLIAASQPYIGTNLNKKVRVVLTEEDNRVATIKSTNTSDQK